MTHALTGRHAKGLQRVLEAVSYELLKPSATNYKEGLDYTCVCCHRLMYSKLDCNRVQDLQILQQST
jgi:hypothetical protein